MTTREAIPGSPEELAEAIADDKRRVALLGDPQKFNSFLKDYMAKMMAEEPDLQLQLRDSMQKNFDEMLKDAGIDPKKVARIPMGQPDTGGSATPVRGPHNSVYATLKELGLTAKDWRQIAATGTGPGMAIAGDFLDLGDFAQSISAHIDKRGLDARVKVLNETQGDQGGFLVPEEFRAELLFLTLEEAIVRPRATVIPMAGQTFKMPSIRSASHASNVFGGVQGYWVPESGAVTLSEPQFAQVMLTAKKLLGGTRLANELLRDSSIALEAVITALFARAIAWFEDDAFIAGIGGGQPLGILNGDATISVTKETGQQTTTLIVENVIKMFSRMLPSSIMRSVWIMNPDVQPQLYTMNLAVGTGGAPMFFPAGGITGSPNPTLLGRPILFSEKCETLGTAGDVYLADLSYYLIGDRMSLEFASSEHARFANDETDFRFIQRVDGRPWIDTALTPRNGTNTLSPFVTVATRA